MIPILFQHDEVDFETNGIGRLYDCISCVVREERNGVFECQFVYPITGQHYYDITEGTIVYCTHDETQVPQPFEIYAHTAPIDGKVTFYAQHITYRLNRMVVMPFTATSVSEAFGKIPNKTVTTCPFTFWTDKTTTGNFGLDEPRSVRGVLGGQEGSILDAFGTGEYEWDKFNVKLHLHRGTDSGVEIRYGKNLVDITDDIDNGSSYNAVVPYWLPNDDESSMVTLTEKVIVYDGEDFVDPTDSSTVIIGVVPLDLSSDFDNQPTEAQLRQRAQSRLASANSLVPRRTTEVNFVALWQTEEYKEFAPLQRVRLCDTVTVHYPELGVESVTQKVVKTEYNVLLDRYDRIELGESSYSFSQIIMDDIGDAMKDVPTESFIEAAINNATRLITGGLGGHVYIKPNADGEPEEILIMDNADINQAVKLWRWNVNGLGYSSTGYNGTYGTAITMDGSIVADYITTGTLNAARVNAGILQDRTSTNFWNLDTGEFRLTPNAKVKVGNTDSSLSSYVGGIADDAIDDYDEDLNQTAIFNKLTNNSANEGIYLSNGHLYVNASMINTGSIDADLIKAGILKSQDSNSNFSLNMATGALTMKNATLTGGSLTTTSNYYKTVVSDGSVRFYYNNTAAGSISAKSVTALNGPGPFITISDNAGGGGFIVSSPPGSNADQLALWYDRDRDKWTIDRGLAINCDTAITGSITTSLLFDSSINIKTDDDKMGINSDSIGIALYDNSYGAGAYVRVDKSGSVSIYAPSGLYVNGTRIAG